MPLFAVKNNRKPDSSREGMLEGLSLGIYLLLVEYTVTLFRAGNPAETPSSFDPPPATPNPILLGRFFAASRARLRETAARLGVHHLAKLAGCPAR
jgi:hypothetical protein